MTSVGGQRDGQRTANPAAGARNQAVLAFIFLMEKTGGAGDADNADQNPKGVQQRVGGIFFSRAHQVSKTASLVLTIQTNMNGL
jgi:hypothetical protein